VKYTLNYPMQYEADPRLMAPDTVVGLARAAEAAGFSALAFTEHPAPSHKWITHGGHASLDSLTALTYVAAVTERIKLMTYLLVLPYRNPLLAAKQIATADVLSGGRLITTVGAGYLRSEFLALGVDFEERNPLFDEALQVITQAPQATPFIFTGRHFRAVGQTLVPQPVQRPHPPVWVGGNTALAMTRAATLADGWSPVINDPIKSNVTRTAQIVTPKALGSAIEAVRAQAHAAGRDGDALAIQAQWSAMNDLGAGWPSLLDAAGRLGEVGVDWAVFTPPGEDADLAVEVVLAFGEQIIAHGA
jgi:probable F420-dependent oxidoreductase